jgi:hypothetical protein
MSNRTLVKVFEEKIAKLQKCHVKSGINFPGGHGPILFF